MILSPVLKVWEGVVSRSNWAEQEVKRLKRDGLTGSFTTFGYKLVDPLDAIGLIIDGNKMGVYQVKKVTKPTTT